jgi:hypothetical protein
MADQSTMADVEAPRGLHIAAMVFPVGDVVHGEVLAVVAEFGFDFEVGEAVVEHLVEFVANLFREAGGFAAVAALGGVRRGAEDLGAHNS